MESDLTLRVFDLPLFFARGTPTSLETMSLEEMQIFLRFLIQWEQNLENLRMEDISLNKITRPKWWPEEVLLDEKILSQKEQIHRVIQSCYIYRNCTFCIKFCRLLVTECGVENILIKDNKDGTRSILKRTNKKVLGKFSNQNQDYDKVFYPNAASSLVGRTVPYVASMPIVDESPGQNQFKRTWRLSVEQDTLPVLDEEREVTMEVGNHTLPLSALNLESDGETIVSSISDGEISPRYSPSSPSGSNDEDPTSRSSLGRLYAPRPDAQLMSWPSDISDTESPSVGSDRSESRKELEQLTQVKPFPLKEISQLNRRPSVQKDNLPIVDAEREMTMEVGRITLPPSALDLESDGEAIRSSISDGDLSLRYSPYSPSGSNDEDPTSRSSLGRLHAPRPDAQLMSGLSVMSDAELPSAGCDGSENSPQLEQPTQINPFLLEEISQLNRRPSVEMDTLPIVDAKREVNMEVGSLTQPPSTLDLDSSREAIMSSISDGDISLRHSPNSPSGSNDEGPTFQSYLDRLQAPRPHVQPMSGPSDISDTELLSVGIDRPESGARMFSYDKVASSFGVVTSVLSVADPSSQPLTTQTLSSSYSLPDILRGSICNAPHNDTPSSPNPEISPSPSRPQVSKELDTVQSPMTLSFSEFKGKSPPPESQSLRSEPQTHPSMQKNNRSVTSPPSAFGLSEQDLRDYCEEPLPSMNAVRKDNKRYNGLKWDWEESASGPSKRARRANVICSDEFTVYPGTEAKKNNSGKQIIANNAEEEREEKGVEKNRDEIFSPGDIVRALFSSHWYEAKVVSLSEVPEELQRQLNVKKNSVIVKFIKCQKYCRLHVSKIKKLE